MKTYYISVFVAYNAMNEDGKLYLTNDIFSYILTGIKTEVKTIAISRACKEVLEINGDDTLISYYRIEDIYETSSDARVE